MKYEQNIKIVSAYLPFALRNAVANVKNLQSKIIEIRLIREKPIVLRTVFERYFITEDYNLSDTYAENLIISSSSDIDETFRSMCEYSVYSKQGEISNGFITLSGGNRAGICGTAVNKNNSVYNIRDISSINIRVADEIIDCGKLLLKKINLNKGVLICGAPCSGKTTVLRDMARLLSYKYKVSLIDTRLELAGCNKGIAQFDVGLCDVFSAYNKHDGFEHSLRCMSPEIIICDEIGGSDILSVEYAQKSGVRVIASAHCRDKGELIRKPDFNKLIKSKCFSSIVFLKSGKNLGQVSEIISGDKLC
jgi:stage III sporulation protein AA